MYYKVLNSPVYYPNAWYVVYNVRFSGMHQGLFHTICTTNCSIHLSTTPMHGMLFAMSDLVDCIRDCSMLYVLQSAQLSPVYYPNAWYVVCNVRLSGMHQGLFHAIRTTKCSIFACYNSTEWYVVYNGRLLVQPHFCPFH